MSQASEPKIPNDRWVLHPFDPVFDGTSLKTFLAMMGVGAAGVATSEGLVSGATDIGTVAAFDSAGMVMGGAARAATHGFVSRGLFGFGGDATEMALDYFIFNDFLSSGDDGKTHYTAESAEVKELGTSAKVITEYGLLRKQLGKHKGASETLTRLDAKLETLGMVLPTKDQLQEIKKEINRHFHDDVLNTPEKKAEFGGVAAIVNGACDTLKNEKLRSDYAETLAKFDANPALKKVAESLFSYTMGDAWKSAAEAAKHAVASHIGLLEGPAKTVSVGFAENYAKAGTAKQAAIVFGGIGGVSLVSYYLPKAIGEWRGKAGDEEKNHRLKALAYGGTTLGGAGLAAAALNQYQLSGGALR